MLREKGWPEAAVAVGRLHILVASQALDNQTVDQMFATDAMTYLSFVWISVTVYSIKLAEVRHSPISSLVNRIPALCLRGANIGYRALRHHMRHFLCVSRSPGQSEAEIMFTSSCRWYITACL